jgi:GntR family transcriptional regulator
MHDSDPRQSAENGQQSPVVTEAQTGEVGEQAVVVTETDRRIEMHKLTGVGPMYRQIADDLRQKIESGKLGHGDQLPTELELREGYEASRNTVRDAVKWLIGRGLVETRPGQGTFVVQKIDPFVTSLGSTGSGVGEGTAYYASQVEAERRKATVSAPRIEVKPGTEAAELHVAENETVVSRHQQRYIDGTPWSLQTSFYPMSFVNRGAVNLIQAVDMPDGVVKYLTKVLGIKEIRWRDTITVRAPDATEAAFFQLPDDGRVAVVEIRKTAFGASGEPLRLTVTTYPADRNKFLIDVGDVPAADGLAAPLNEANAPASGSSGQERQG